jgi:hypothetical protein
MLLLLIIITTTTTIIIIIIVVVVVAAAAEFILCVLEFLKGIIKARKLSTVVPLQMSATHC